MGDAPPPRVLVVEDDPAIAEAIAFHVARAGMEPHVVADGLAALRSLRAGPPDAMVLDLMLPHVDGWHVIREVRQWLPDLPVIVVTARTNEYDRVEVLGLGADDVLAKPFSMRELVARIRAALRRSRALAGANAPADVVRTGDLVIDPERLVVTRRGTALALTPREFRLLMVLADSGGRALSRDDIFRRVWGGERGHGDRSVDVLVRRLRRKVDEGDGSFTHIQTLHGVGYRLEAVERSPTGAEQLADLRG